MAWSDLRDRFLASNLQRHRVPSLRPTGRASFAARLYRHSSKDIVSLAKTPPDTIDIGDLERTYAVVREIGRGGMGAVVLARHRSAGHRVAIKVASTEKFDAEGLARFAREASLMARFRHPNIVRLYDVRQIAEGRVGIVMEYVRGVSLARLLAERKPLPFDLCKGILHDLGQALAHAHANGVIHRDVKPHNVLVEEGSGRAKLSDFGIAKAASDDEVTAVGAVLGTPAYMSPEQIDGREIDGRSDIYSLGVLGWELLSGERPWAGEPLFQLLFKQKHEALPSLRILRPDTPPALLLAVEGALEKDPAHRWPAVSDMLSQLASDEPTAALLEARRRVASSVRSRTTGTSAESATVPLRRRRPRPVAAVPEPHEGEGTTEPNVGPARAAPPASAVAPEPGAAASPPPKRRWLQVAQFGMGIVVGGLLMLLASRQFTPAPAVAPAAGAAPGTRPGTSRPEPRDPAAAAPRGTPAGSERPAGSSPRGGSEVEPAPPAPASAAPFGGAEQPPPTPSAAVAAAPVATGNASELPLARRADAHALANRARSLVYAGSVAPAGAIVDSALALDPLNANAYIVRARLRIGRGAVRDAWTDIELAARTGARWEALALTTMLRASELGPAVARVRIMPEVRAALQPRRTLDADRAVALAGALAQVGDTATALTLLELAGAPDSRLPVLLADPLLDPVRSSARFDRVRRRAGG
jgi:serine/threonine protein kinase